MTKRRFEHAVWLACGLGLLGLGCTESPPQAPGIGMHIEQAVTPAPRFPHDGWNLPAPPAALPTAPPELVEQGFPHEYPEIPQVASETTMPWMSGQPMALFGDDLYIVDIENGQLVIFDRHTARVSRSIPVGERPAQVVVDPAGTAYVTVRDAAEVVQIPRDTWKPRSVRLGTEPLALALTPDASMLVVADHAEGRVRLVDTESFTTFEVLSGFDRPRTIAFARDGLMVIGDQRGLTRARFATTTYGNPTLALNTQRYDVGLLPSQPWDEQLAPFRSMGVSANRALAAVEHPDSGRLIFTYMQATTGFANGQIAPFINMDEGGEVGDGGYGASGFPAEFPELERPITAAVATTSSVSNSEAIEAAFPVRHPETGHVLQHLVSQPRSINHHPTYQLAFVVGYTTDTVLVLATHVESPMRSPVGLLRTGKGPTAVVFSPDGETAYVLNRLDYTITEYALGAMLAANGETMAHETTQLRPPSGNEAVAPPTELLPQRQARFGIDPRPADVQRGHRLFTFANNPSISEHGVHACESCHIDQGEDSLVWVVPEGLRQTPSLSGRLADTGPFNWAGTEDELRTNMDNTIHRMGGAGLSANELDDLEAFLLSTRPMPNPRRATTLSTAAETGKALFFDPVVGCGTCHVGSSTTDGRLYDVGTVGSHERKMLPSAALTLNTPSLTDLFATAPYLHDGSAPTLIDVLEHTSGKMGQTGHLTPQEKSDLVEYLLSL